MPGWRSLVDAGRGLAHLARRERHFQCHLAAAAAVVLAASFCGLQRGEWALVTGAIAMVLVAEAFNSALELLADAVHPEHHPLVGKAKDAAAGAVLIASLASVVMGLFAFWPHISRLLFGRQF